MIMISMFLFHKSMIINSWKQSCKLHFYWDQNSLFQPLCPGEGFEHCSLKGTKYGRITQSLICLPGLGMGPGSGDLWGLLRFENV